MLEQARQELVALQRGDSTNLSIWKEMQEVSRVHSIKSTHAFRCSLITHWERVSTTINCLAVVTELMDQGLAVESQGAKVVFFQGFRNWRITLR